LKYYFKKLNDLNYYINLKRRTDKLNMCYDYESSYALKFNSVKKNILRKVRKNNHKKFVDNLEILKDKNYFIFPLHLQPEASTSGQATYFSELLITIKYISFSLPFPYVLAVKEHPSAIGTRQKRFYKELKKIPNVVFLSSKENNEMLIKKSKGVITLTSTLGLEAALKGKKVIVLGDVFYDFHPNCFKIKNYEEIEKIILEKEIVISKKDLDIINAKFWKLYKSTTIEGSIFNKKISKSQVKQFNNFIKKL
jgi:capsule polysaccharide modification protein KpsS